MPYRRVWSNPECNNLYGINWEEIQMNQRLGLLIICLVAALALTAEVTFAQDDTPTPPPDEHDETINGADVVGDSGSDALAVVREYLQTRDPALLADEAVFHDRTMLDPVHGRDAITRMQDDFHTRTFAGAIVDPFRYIVVENVVVAEFLFSGVHSDPYMGAPATGMDVQVMMVGVFEVEGDHIRSVDLYYDAASIHAQIGMAPSAGFGAPVVTDPALAAPPGVETMRHIIENPPAFDGETVTVEGFIAEMVGETAFILEEDGFLGNERILVVDNADDGLSFIRLEDARVRVTGTLHLDHATAVETGAETQAEDLAGFEGLPVLMATSAHNLDDIETMGTLTDQPEAFYNQSVRLEGLVGENIGERTFFLREDAFLGGLFGENRVLVFDGTEDGLDFIPLSDTRVRVAGTVRAFIRADIENEINYPLDDERFAEHEGRPVIVATSIVNLEDVTTLGNLTDEPEAFYGQQVSIEGLVGDRVGAQGFLLNDDVFLGDLFGTSRVLVIHRGELPFDVEAWDGERVSVMGTVHPFTRAEIEDELGHPLDDERYADYEGEAVIIADEIAPRE
jgi:hypothetical protein